MSSTKSLPTSSLAPLTEDKTYRVPRAYFWIAFWLALYIVPMVVVFIFVDHAWWALGVLCGNLHAVYRLLFCKTVKLTFHANNDNTVTHYNAMGGTVSCQTAVPLSRYEKIRFNQKYHRITFVKTDEYYDSIVDQISGCFRYVI